MRWLGAMVLISTWAAAGEKPTLEVNVGTVGVVSVTKQVGDALTLKVVFPVSGAETDRVTLHGRLVLFDGAGELGEVKNAKLAVRFWCENDGGQQYRPEATVTLSAKTLKRALVPVKAAQSIAAFVVVAPEKQAPSLSALPAGAAALSGDLDGDGKPEARVSTAPDEANNCDGLPKNNLTITLTTAAGSSALRCCGP